MRLFRCDDFSRVRWLIVNLERRWQAFANGTTPENLYEFEEGIAYDAGILYQTSTTPTDEYLIDPDGTQLLKKDQSVTRKGSVNDLNLTLGGNYRHKLMAKCKSEQIERKNIVSSCNKYIVVFLRNFFRHVWNGWWNIAASNIICTRLPTPGSNPTSWGSATFFLFLYPGYILSPCII